LKILIVARHQKRGAIAREKAIHFFVEELHNITAL
jgi:hypothetical protein